MPVIGYHYFARSFPSCSPGSSPCGGLSAQFWLFRYGDFGVELLFIIFGFVISMTLFRCRTTVAFFWKRFSRLFPTMLLCSLLSVAVLHALARGVFAPQWRDFLPSLTFADPLLWANVFGVPFKAVDGAYWLLFAEVNFYFWVSVIYFSFGPHRYLRASAWLFGALVLGYLAVQAMHLSHLWAIDFIFALGSLPWLTAGIGFYTLFADARSCIAWLLLTETALALATLQLGTHAQAASLDVAIGMASCGLYLLHQSIGVAILDLVRQGLGAEGCAASALHVPLLAAMLILTSLVIYRFWEAPAKNALLSWATGRRPAAIDQPVRETP